MGHGGAWYNGENPTDAGIYMDRSQGALGFGHTNPGHPRDHASIVKPTISQPCIENYSKNCTKSGFESYEQQNYVCHCVLMHPFIRQQIDILNQYTQNPSKQFTRQAATLSVHELKLPEQIECGCWRNGEREKTFILKAITIILQHFKGLEHHTKAPVQIFTFFPRYLP